jgi:hypothetical protein
MFTAAQQTQITASITAATTAIGQLSAGTSALTGAETLQQVDSEVNTVLAAAGAALPALAVAFPGIATIVPEYDAAVALLPIVEAWVNTTIMANTQVTTPVTPVPPAPISPTPVSAAQARQQLGIVSVTQ